MIANLRNRYLVFASISLLFLASTAFYLRYYPISSQIQEPIPSTHANIPKPTPVPYPKYKPEPVVKSPPIVDNFPLAAKAHSAADLPPIPSWNKPPEKHIEEATPLFIGFTRNWRLLQQAVVSYITAGWPPEDIYVVENTGVMDSNVKGRLSLQNPFFVNYTRLNIFGVNIIRTPTLLTFAQLQNFYLHTAIEKGWHMYFWSHMDVVALSFEGRFKDAHPGLLSASTNHSASESVYYNAVKEMRAIQLLTPPDSRWAIRFFAYDHLSLVNTAAFIEVGGWDSMVPYYTTDCDMHARLQMAGFKLKIAEAGMIFDIASSLDDLIVLYRKKGTGIQASFTDPNILQDKIIEEEEKAKAEKAEAEKAEAEKVGVEKEKHEGRAEPTSTSSPDPVGTSIIWEEDDIYSSDFEHMAHVLGNMRDSKVKSQKGRNTWQSRQLGGKGEPFYRDAAGFDKAIEMTIQHGRNVYAEKWGHRDCDILEKGLAVDDAWRVEHDW